MTITTILLPSNLNSKTWCYFGFDLLITPLQADPISLTVKSILTVQSRQIIYRKKYQTVQHIPCLRSLHLCFILPFLYGANEFYKQLSLPVFYSHLLRVIFIGLYNDCIQRAFCLEMLMSIFIRKALYSAVSRVRVSSIFLQQEYSVGEVAMRIWEHALLLFGGGWYSGVRRAASGLRVPPPVIVIRRPTTMLIGPHNQAN